MTRSERRQRTAAAHAPTEAEIRAAARRARGVASVDLGAWVSELAEPIAYHEPEDAGDTSACLWTDLRPSEAKRLSDLVEDVYRTTDLWEAELVDRIIEAVVEAGVTFASEYPEAPRA